MAAQQALERQPRAARNAKSLDGLVGVCRTGRLETAASSNPQRQIHFVKAQRGERQAHRDALRHAVHSLGSRRNKSAVSAANSALLTLFFGCMTMSHPADISWRWQRTISRTRRRMRLRDR